jgi:hypothetical protein
VALTFDEAVAQVVAASPPPQVVPVHVTAHTDDGTVFYGSGGLMYEPPPQKSIYVVRDPSSLFNAVDKAAYAFDGEALTVSRFADNGRVKVWNNVIYDTSRGDDLLPPNYQTFLVTHSEYIGLKLGRAKNESGVALILRVSHSAGGSLLSTDVVVEEDGTLLRGIGAALFLPGIASWAVSLFEPIASAGNEVN